MVIKINAGKIIKTNVIPINKFESKLSKDSTDGNTETKTRKCKITPSNMFNRKLEYGLKH